MWDKGSNSATWQSLIGISVICLWSVCAQIIIKKKLVFQSSFDQLSPKTYNTLGPKIKTQLYIKVNVIALYFEEQNYQLTFSNGYTHFHLTPHVV